MKKIEIGGKPFRLLQNTKEVSGRRWKEFERWRAMHTFGVDLEDMVVNLKRYNDAFDRYANSECHLYINNMLLNAGNLGERRNATHYLYALIVLAEGEEKNEPDTLDSAYLKEKLEGFYDLGVSQGEMEDTVENFIHTCRASSPAGSTTSAPTPGKKK